VKLAGKHIGFIIIISYLLGILTGVVVSCRHGASKVPRKNGVYKLSL